MCPRCILIYVDLDLGVITVPQEKVESFLDVMSCNWLCPPIYLVPRAIQHASINMYVVSSAPVAISTIHTIININYGNS